MSASTLALKSGTIRSSLPAIRGRLAQRGSHRDCSSPQWQAVDRSSHGRAATASGGRDEAAARAGGGRCRRRAAARSCAGIPVRRSGAGSPSSTAPTSARAPSASRVRSQPARGGDTAAGSAARIAAPGTAHETPSTSTWRSWPSCSAAGRPTVRLPEAIRELRRRRATDPGASNARSRYAKRRREGSSSSGWRRAVEDQRRAPGAGAHANAKELAIGLDHADLDRRGRVGWHRRRLRHTSPVVYVRAGAASRQEPFVAERCRRRAASPERTASRRASGPRIGRCLRTGQPFVGRRRRLRIEQELRLPVAGRIDELWMWPLELGTMLSPPNARH